MSSSLAKLLKILKPLMTISCWNTLVCHGDGQRLTPPRGMERLWGVVGGCGGLWELCCGRQKLLEAGVTVCCQDVCEGNEIGRNETMLLNKHRVCSSRVCSCECRQQQTLEGGGLDEGWMRAGWMFHDPKPNTWALLGSEWACFSQVRLSLCCWSLLI